MIVGSVLLNQFIDFVDAWNCVALRSSKEWRNLGLFCYSTNLYLTYVHIFDNIIYSFYYTRPRRHSQTIYSVCCSLIEVESRRLHHIVSCEIRFWMHIGFVFIYKLLGSLDEPPATITLERVFKLMRRRDHAGRHHRQQCIKINTRA